MTQERKKLVELKNVSLTFNKGKSNEVKAIDDVSFAIYEGEIFGLVGESGSGKTTIGRSVLKLSDIDSGTVTFSGNEISSLKGKDLHDFRKTAQMIFQDPQASLNGRMKIRDIIAEGIDIHKLAKSKEEREAKVKELIDLVGLNEDHLSRYPHEFSGGQRQRIGIARALAVNPHFIVADEPISALDVSIQAQVVNLMQKLQHEQGLTYLFIAHDLSMVKYISDRIGVMHWGKLLEVGPADEIYHNPIHPYTKSLLSAIPEPDPERERKRQHLIYDSSIENDGENRHMYEIRSGHFVYATEAEAKNYKEEAKSN
ncbi:ABC transporter ATP-binding protein [Streptococcus thermophilus]|uniref:Oligopeptide ABC transporter (ATP-binding protein) n=1 Tax=Streptococcus thermophilus TaxID=1308 RepID=A0A7U7C712_STRTR|nr:ATP-binding cassette domain-containing protein [Streptococcus thermophilus]MBW7802199.1 ATP-binding cassette domain-containing protein [Streptococcus thermophilus]MBW7821800.1 ATP-binding cassette domain-containing protein [Streptococcus thermophilus]PJH81184.1 ABC transporter ATP-binding protein [Streptococcus thermophilus]PJH83221.1 ABC transporter ATP-binding protein [Streptococcus thermophilus]CAD0142585.1 oligopeptide ABC transporter (ATP-binding protein) [Streptococcus thermophilus]